MASLEEVNEALCRSIIESRQLRVVGPTEGYRNKITYSLPPQPAATGETMPEGDATTVSHHLRSLQTSPLASSGVNAVAMAVFDALSDTSQKPWRGALEWMELNVKITRKNEAMVKLILRELVPGAFGSWRSSNSRTQFVTSVQNHPNVTVTHNCSVVCIVAHVAAAVSDNDNGGCDRPAKRNRSSTGDGSDVDDDDTEGIVAVKKPSKLDAYVPLTDDGCDHVVELTPNDIPFVLSPDSFCEVNHKMEDAIFEASVEFLRLREVSSSSPSSSVCRDGNSSAASPPLARAAFMTGRDVNSVVKSFEPFYGPGMMKAVSTCPRVLADAKRNGLDQCAAATKHDVWQHLESAMSHKRNGTAVEQHVLITAGRHGLYPQTVKELVRLAISGVVDDVLYVSCNVESMIRDVFIFKQGFYLANCRTFDFFPQTRYVMSGMHFKALSPFTANKGARSLLVLPVGPPGSGKSTIGRHVHDAFSVAASRDSWRRALKLRKEFFRRTASGVVSIPRFVDVTLDPAGCISASVVERDAHFRALQDQGCSLKVTRERTHEALLRACRELMTVASRSVPQASLTADGEPTALVSAAESSSGHKAPPLRLLYLDSTNGSAEARQVYRRESLCSHCVELWFELMMVEEDAMPTTMTTTTDRGDNMETAAPASPSPFPTMTSVTEVLLSRCRLRGEHPSFPADETAQRLKIANIMKGIEETTKGSSGTTRIRLRCPVKRAENGGNDASSSYVEVTKRIVATVLWVVLFCSESVALSLLEDMPWAALMQKWLVGPMFREMATQLGGERSSSLFSIL